MVLVTAVLKWWQPGYVLVSWTVLGVAAGLALLGEVLEFALGAAGARHSGGSTRATALAILGSLIGGLWGRHCRCRWWVPCSGPASVRSPVHLSGICGRGARCSRASKPAGGPPWAGSGGLSPN